MLRQTKVAGLSAVGFAVLIVLGNLLLVPTDPPRPGAEAGAATAFFATESGAVWLASALAPPAWLLAAVFGAGAVAALRGDAWALAGFAGLILQIATFTGVVATRLALTQDSATGLWALHEALFALNGTVMMMCVDGIRQSLTRIGTDARGVVLRTICRLWRSCPRTSPGWWL